MRHASAHGVLHNRNARMDHMWKLQEVALLRRERNNVFLSLDSTQSNTSLRYA